MAFVIVDHRASRQHQEKRYFKGFVKGIPQTTADVKRAKLYTTDYGANRRAWRVSSYYARVEDGHTGHGLGTTGLVCSIEESEA